MTVAPDRPIRVVAARGTEAEEAVVGGDDGERFATLLTGRP